jgi:hypothetical protein
MRIRLLFSIVIFFLFQVSCKKYEPAEEAFFIKPSLVSVSTSSTQGSGSNKITELWVYVNGFFKGAYPVEKSIPIVTNGKQVNIQVFAGIINNGIKSTRIFSPFYELLSFDILAPRGTVVDRSFTFNYRTNTTFAWLEDFEGLSSTVIKSPNSEIGYDVISGANSFEGKCLKMAGTSTTSILMLESAGNAFELPLGSPNVYLELNYKCNYLVTVGLINSSGKEINAFHLNPQSNWNKIYISMAAAANESGSSNKYKVFLRTVKTGDEPAELFLDNIKLVYLK